VLRLVRRVAAHGLDAMHVFVSEADTLAGRLLRRHAARHDFRRVGRGAVDRRVEDDRGANGRAVGRLQINDVANVDRRVVQHRMSRASDQVRGSETSIHGVCSLKF